MKIKIARPPEGVWAAYEANAVPAGYEVKEGEDFELPFKPESYPAIEMAVAVLRRTYSAVYYTNESDLSHQAYLMGRAAYNAELESDVDSIVKDVFSGEINDRDDLYERIQEVCDSTVTYTRKVREILLYTENFNYGFDEGVLSTRQPDFGPRRSTDWATSIAFWSYYGDLQDALGKQLKMNKKHLGRCNECKCKGYVVEDDVVKICGAYDCDHGEKFATRDDAIKQAVENEAVKTCRVCDNRSYYVTDKKQIEACPSCAASMEKADAEELASEDGYEPEENDE